MSAKTKTASGVSVLMSSEVARRIRQHARSSPKAEVCGVLLGEEKDGRTVIDACIAGVNAAQGGAHVTFTQDTWEHIYKIKDAEYPEHRIVGWYHSHPGFGVFLSDHDTFIQQNFFSAAMQVAWVYDPHSDEEGCFGWKDGEIERLTRIAMHDSPESRPVIVSKREAEDEMEAEQIAWNDEPRSRRKSESRWMSWTFTAVSYICVLLIGALAMNLVSPRVPFSKDVFRSMTERQFVTELQGLSLDQLQWMLNGSVLELTRRMGPQRMASVLADVAQQLFQMEPVMIGPDGQPLKPSPVEPQQPNKDGR